MSMGAVIWRSVVATVLVLLVSSSTNAQVVDTAASAESKQRLAYEKTTEAVKLMDNGSIELAIILLEESIELDPDNILHPYELSYAYIARKNYDKAITILEALTDHKDVYDQVYQLLGNCHSYNGDKTEAIETYERGLVRFPKSGCLHLERGNMELHEKNYDRAIHYYELGIKLAPKFPSNYYRAAVLFCSSVDALTGIIYGEMFMNLERNSKRTAEMSKLLYDTYRSRITILGKDSVRADFCQIVMTMEELTDTSSLKMPFCMVFGASFMPFLAFETQIDMSALHALRSSFIKDYFEKGSDKTHPNHLFDYMYQVQAAGQMEAYNHWVMMKGDEPQYTSWKTANPEKHKAFAEWFTKFPMQVDEQHKFYRLQYTKGN